MTSSPGSRIPSIAATMPSVAPQVTVISVSGSGSQPGYVRAVFAAIASRSGFAPHVMAYWLTSAKTASAAARLISSGAGKSGKPWARLTAPAATARRFISRITDSVNDSAFALIRPMAESVRAAWSPSAATTPDGLVVLRPAGSPPVPVRVGRDDDHDE